MSDQLLERLAVAAEGILAHIKTGGAVPPKPTAANSGGDAKADAAKVAAEKAAVEKAAKEKAAAKAVADAKTAAAAKVAAAGAGKNAPAAGTKAPGGKHTIDEVREMIRKVASNASLGRETAKEILMDDGGGAEKVPDIKPENYDAVYEACQVALTTEGAGSKAAEPEDDLM